MPTLQLPGLRMSISNESDARARPYGFAGLAVSLIAFAALTAIVTAAAVLLLWLADAVFLGREHASGFVASLFSGDPAAPSGPIFIIGSVLYIAAIGSLLVLARWRGGASWRELVAWRGFRTDNVYWLLLAAAVLYGLCAGLIVEKIYPDAKNWFRLPSGGLAMSVAFLLVVVLAPLAEELLFRGWLFTAVRAKWSAWVTIALTSVLFALAHWESTHIYALAVLPVGLLLGFLRERTGSVLATALLHGIYNCSGFLTKLLLPD